LPSTKDVVEQKGLFALFKGAPNTAKSGAAYSFPNAFVFDFDRKMPTVAKKHFPEKEFNWECFDDVYQVSDFLQPWLSGKVQCPYETLIVDTVTSLSTLCLCSVDKTKGTDVIKMMQHKQIGKGGAVSVEVMGFDYYNAEANFFERYFMESLRILWAREGNPKHVIVIAHEISKEQTNMITGLTTITKTIVTAGTKVAAFIPSRFDEEYVFKSERPALGSNEANKRICITCDFEDTRTAYKFPNKIDFTNKSLYDELNKVAKWSSIGLEDSNSLNNMKLTTI
jgi:AAA domain